MKLAIVILTSLALVTLAGTASAHKKPEAAQSAPQKAHGSESQPATPAQAPPPPVAGVQPVVLGVTVDEMAVVVKGWSVKKKLLGEPVYNDQNQNIGSIADLIVAPDKAVSFAIIGVGGFLGIDKHDVAIPMSQLKMDEGKMILTGATKEALKAMPSFQQGHHH